MAGSCSGSYGGYSGVISSPNFPYDYCNNLDCQYSITVPSSYKIRLYFTSFNTENGWDFVKVGTRKVTFRTYESKMVSLNWAFLTNDLTISYHLTKRFTTDRLPVVLFYENILDLVYPSIPTQVEIKCWCDSQRTVQKPGQAGMRLTRSTGNLLYSPRRIIG